MMRFYKVRGSFRRMFTDGWGVMCEGCFGEFCEDVKAGGHVGQVYVGRADAGAVCSVCGMDRVAVKRRTHLEVDRADLERMKFDERLSVREMAKRLGSSVGAVHARLREYGLTGKAEKSET